MQKSASRHHFLFYCLIIALFISLAKIMILEVFGLADSDYYWHLTLGKYIVQNKHIFETDIFSWLAAENGYTEIAHSWLGSVIIYLCSALFKNKLIASYFYAFVASFLYTFPMLFWYGKATKKESGQMSNYEEFYLIFIGFLMIMVSPSTRPADLGFALFVCSMYILHDVYDHENSKKFWFLPIIALVWANVHGGSIPIMFCFVLLFIVLSFLPKFTFCLIEQKNGFSWRRTKKLLIAAASSFAASLINPYGWKLFIYFFSINTEITKKYIIEWQPILLNSPIVAFVLASIFIIALLAKEKKTIDISYLLPVFATLFMTAKYMRIAFYLVFCTIMLIWKFLYDTEDGTWFDGLPVINIGSMLPTIVVSCCIVAMLIFQPTKTIYTSEGDGSGMSKELLSAIHELAPERMYNDYNTGGFLIYNGLQSFIDSRADLFPDKVLDAAMRFPSMIDYTADELQVYIDEYQFDAILIKKNCPLSAWLSIHDGWREYYSDDAYAMFART